MKGYKCGKNNGHRGVKPIATPDESPHAVRIICAECGYFIKWGTHKDVVAINLDGGAREVAVDIEALRRHMKPVIDAMREVGLI